MKKNINREELEKEILDIMQNLVWDDKTKPFAEIDNVFFKNNAKYPYCWFELKSEDFEKLSNCSFLSSIEIEMFVLSKIEEKIGLTRKKTKSLVYFWINKLIETLQKEKISNWTIELLWVSYNNLLNDSGHFYSAILNFKINFY